MKDKKVRGLSVQKAAERLGVSIITLRRWDKSGVLSPQRTAGGQRRYTVSQINAFLKAQDNKKQIQKPTKANVIPTSHGVTLNSFQSPSEEIPKQVQNDNGGKDLLIPKIVLSSSPSHHHERPSGFNTLLNNGIEILSGFTEIGSFYAQKNPHVRRTGRKLQEGYIALSATVSFHHKILFSILRSMGIVLLFVGFISLCMLIVGWYYTLLLSFLG